MSKININNVDLKHFITIVRKYDQVWNKYSEGNKEYQSREAAWHAITKETNFGDVRRAKIQWKKLRDNHREALKRRQMNKRDGKTNVKWKYENLMEFLLPHININIDNSYTDDTNGHDIEIADYNSDSEKLANISERIKQENLATNPLESNDESNDDPVIEFIQEQNSKWNEKEDESNVLTPIDHFFASVCESIKRLPIAAQLRLKKKIMLLVIDEEELALKSKS